MTSEIVSNTIDGEYPVAGIDNDTQGFRDNFSIIKTALQTANSEVTLLQNSTAKIDQDNDFKGTSLINANLTGTTLRYFSAGTYSEGSDISFLNGHYQTIAISSGITPETALSFNLADWPQREGMSKVTIEFKGTGADGDLDNEYTITMTGEGGAAFKRSQNFPSEIKVRSVSNRENPIIVEFWTTNQGQTIYANYLGEFTSV